MNKKQIKDNFGTEEVDKEHLSRLAHEDPPPRVINPRQLQQNGLTLNERDLQHLSALMTGVFPKDKRVDVLRIYSKYQTREGVKIFNNCGDVACEIDIAPGKATKKIGRPSEFSHQWNTHFFLIFHSIVVGYETEIFPHYLHFILKDSQECPLPTQYMEFKIASATMPTKENLMGDLRFSDIKTGLSKRPSKIRKIF